MQHWPSSVLGLYHLRQLQPLHGQAAYLNLFDNWDGPEVDRWFRYRGATVLRRLNDVPRHIGRRLYVIPGIGPWPSLPPGWLVIRLCHLNRYFDEADLQARAFQAIGVANFRDRLYPLHNNEVTKIFQRYRPEPQSMTDFRDWLHNRNTSLPPGAIDWLIPDVSERAKYYKLGTRPPVSLYDKAYWLRTGSDHAARAKKRVLEPDVGEGEGNHAVDKKAEERPKKRVRSKHQLGKPVIEECLAAIQEERRRIAA